MYRTITVTACGFKWATKTSYQKQNCNALIIDHLNTKDIWLYFASTNINDDDILSFSFKVMQPWISRTKRIYYIICIHLYSLDNHIAPNQVLVFSVFMHSSWPIFHVDHHARENLTLKFGDICCKQSAAYYTETDTILPSRLFCYLN